MNLNKYQAPHDVPREKLNQRYHQLYHPMKYHFTEPFTFHALAAGLDPNDWRTWVALAGRILFGLFVTVTIAVIVTILYVFVLGTIIDCVMNVVGS